MPGDKKYSEERAAKLLQAVQMTTVGMSHMLLLAYERISELEEQVEQLRLELREVKKCQD